VFYIAKLHGFHFTNLDFELLWLVVIEYLSTFGRVAKNKWTDSNPLLLLSVCDVQVALVSCWSNIGMTGFYAQARVDILLALLTWHQDRRTLVIGTAYRAKEASVCCLWKNAATTSAIGVFLTSILGGRSRCKQGTPWSRLVCFSKKCFTIFVSFFDNFHVFSFGDNISTNNLIFLRY